MTREVTSKLKNPCNSLLTDDSDGCKEHKSKLDLISRDDAIDAVTKTQGLRADAFKALVALPTARPKGDVIEVVRCKDCRHSRIEGDTTMFMWCGYWNKPTDGIRYCSDGERRGDANE